MSLTPLTRIVTGQRPLRQISISDRRVPLLFVSGADLYQIFGRRSGGSQIALPAQRLAHPGTEVGGELADFHGPAHQVADGDRPGDFAVADPVERGADGASALAAVRIAAENARLHARAQVGG